jgi:phosphate transport system substrate-binding protein
MRQFMFGLMAVALLNLTACDKTNSAQSTPITGSGSTFIYPLLSKWAYSYQQLHGTEINYQGTGSGAGLQQIQQGIVNFAASDKPLTSEELEKAKLMQFPAVVGGIVLVTHLEGLQSGQLVLNGSTVADIFTGKIAFWDNASIKQLNPSVNLPHEAITVVHRSDGSGTTYNFTHYLADVNADWKTHVGVNTTVNWPVGVGAKGNAGVATYVQQIAGSVGYMEYAYAHENKLPLANLINKEGHTVAPTLDSFSASAKHADWTHVKDYYVILTNQSGADSWPITASTFILLPTVAQNGERTHKLLSFFDWCFSQGEGTATELDYVPMPKSVYEHIEKSWTAHVKTATGKAVWPTLSDGVKTETSGAKAE